MLKMPLARSSPCGRPPLQRTRPLLTATLWFGRSALAAWVPRRGCGVALHGARPKSPTPSCLTNQVLGLRSASPLSSDDSSRWELGSPVVSRKHCALQYDTHSGCWSVTDSGSTYAWSSAVLVAPQLATPADSDAGLQFLGCSTHSGGAPQLLRLQLQHVGAALRVCRSRLFHRLWPSRHLWHRGQPAWSNSPSWQQQS